jgi:hypothetical protein
MYKSQLEGTTGNFFGLQSACGLANYSDVTHSNRVKGLLSISCCEACDWNLRPRLASTVHQPDRGTNIQFLCPSAFASSPLGRNRSGVYVVRACDPNLLR